MDGGMVMIQGRKAENGGRKRKNTRNIVIFFISIWMSIVLSSCAAIPIRKPLPEEYGATARIHGIPGARVWGDEIPAHYDDWFALPRKELADRYPDVMGREHHYLAISGGGANGAFSAGLLVGWTAAGTRPKFTLVTGISTGALAAPFAFLGPEYDDRLKEIYTTYSTADIVIIRNILTAITGYSFVDTKPLRNLIAKYYNKEVMDAIAVEFRKGRSFWIGTTNLDAKRPVVWNIGAIASSGRPEALALIHKIILASASIPGAFPPVLIEVEAEGKRYDEMHVDGGTASQIFLYPAGLDWSRVTQKLEVKGAPHAYLVRNSFLQPEWETVKPKIIPIAGESIDSLIRTQGIGDMYRIYLNCQRDGSDYNLAYIPEHFDRKHKEAFDPVYMGELFELGYQMAKEGYPWAKGPPGFE